MNIQHVRTTTLALAACLFACGGNSPPQQAKPEPQVLTAVQAAPLVRAPVADGPADGVLPELEQTSGHSSVSAPRPVAPVVAATPSPAPPPPEVPASYRPKKAKPYTWVQAPGANYSILATEVTVAQFFACVKAGQCKMDTVTPFSPMGSTCNYGRPGADEHPMNCVNYFGAEQVCSFAKGRICTVEEWLAACAGKDGRKFPYGDIFDVSKCNMQSETTRIEGRELQTAPVRSFSACVGGIEGLWDMSGNVNEWVNGCKGTYCKFLGGGYMGNDPIHHFNSCSGVCAGNQKDFASATIGVRCCRDQP